MLADGTVVVGRTGARLAVVGTEVLDVPAFESVSCGDHSENPRFSFPRHPFHGGQLERPMGQRPRGRAVVVRVTWRSAIAPDADVPLSAEDRSRKPNGRGRRRRVRLE